MFQCHIALWWPLWLSRNKDFMFVCTPICFVRGSCFIYWSACTNPAVMYLLSERSCICLLGVSSLLFSTRYFNWILELFRQCKGNTRCATSRAGIVNSVFCGARVAQSLEFCAVFWRSMFVLFLPLYCLSFIDARLLITHFVSSIV